MLDTLTQPRPRLLFTALAALALVPLVGCGDGGPPNAPELVFTCSPVVDDTTPAIERDTTIAALAGVPLQIGEGSVTVSVNGGEPEVVSPQFSDTMLLVSPPGTGDAALWPSRSRIEVAFTGFRGTDGSRQDEDQVFTCAYDTIDDEEPVPEAFNPAQNTCISARIDGLRVIFNEPMNTDPTIGEYTEAAPEGFPDFFVPRSEAVWEVAEEDTEDDALPRVLFIPRIEGRLLAYQQDYQINLKDFVDLAGNVVRNGQFAYRFCTNEDNESPRVIEVTPTTVLTEDGMGNLVDGATGVDPQGTTEICLTFDEEMNPGGTLARLEIDGENAGQVPGVWDEANRTICFNLDLGNGATRLRPNAEHRLILGLLTDRRGNFISNDPILVDNSLDFTTGDDENQPSIVVSTPMEGDMSVDFVTLTEISIQFSERIDQDRVGTLTLDVDGGTSSFEFPPETGYVWDEIGVTLTIDLTSAEGFLAEATRDYAIDLGTIFDFGGNGIDVSSIGGDMDFDFRTRLPSGDNCDEVLRVEDGTVVDGLVQWAWGDGEATVQDLGTTACDEGPSNDLVFRYEKASPSVAEDPVNGRYLFAQIRADANGDAMNIQIFSETCDPEADGNVDVACYANRSRWDITKDVPAGTYYIWVASTSQAGIDAGELSVEERSSVQEGESCIDPFDADSGNYSSLTGPDGGRWDIEVAGAQGADRTRTNFLTFDCGVQRDVDHGVDAVIAFEKESDASFINVDIQTSGMGAATIRAEITDTCDPTSATRVPFCGRNTRSNDPLTFEGGTFMPAGTYYLWIATDSAQSGGFMGGRIAFPEMQVDITETPLEPGEGCAVARNIPSAGEDVVDLDVTDSTVTVDTPSCFDEGVPVNWWKYTAVNGGVAFEPNGNSRVIIADGADGTEFLCESNSSGAAVGRIVDPGDEVCVGIPVDASVTTMSVRDINYTGIAGTTTDLDVTFPADRNVGIQFFMDSDADDIWLGYFQTSGGNGARVARFDKEGSVTATVYDDDNGVSLDTIGRGGVIVGSSLFSLDDRTSETDERLYRLFDGTTFADTRWDTGSAEYGRANIRAMASDGTTVFFVTFQAGPFFTPVTTMYSRVAASGGPVTEVGTNAGIFRINGMAVDDEYYYLAGEDANGERPGVYRISRANFGGTIEAMTPALEFSSGSPTDVQIDDLSNPSYLYVAVNDPIGIHVIYEPDGPTPTYLGEIVSRGAGDAVFTYDRAEDVIYMFQADGDEVIKVE